MENFLIEKKHKTLGKTGRMFMSYIIFMKA